MRSALLVALAALGLGSVPSQAAPPVLVELFTSQSCSSCPPADALLARLAQRPDVLALDLHVTYWNQLGWHDPFSLDAATARQRDYAARLGLEEIYTPQLVAGGRHQAVGSDAGAVAAALAAAQAEAGTGVVLGMRAAGTEVAIDIGAGSGAATLWLAGFDPHAVTHVGGGENGGRTLAEANVVRAIAPVAAWRGAAPASHLAPAGRAAGGGLPAGGGRNRARDGASARRLMPPRRRPIRAPRQRP